MKNEILEILKKDVTDEEKAEAIFNFALLVQQANIIQMLGFADWAATNFSRLREIWIPKIKGKQIYTTEELFHQWLKVRGIEK